MSQYLVQVVTSSPAVADLILKSPDHDTTCTGGVREHGTGTFAVHAVVEAHQLAALRKVLGVVQVDVLVDIEANRQERLKELMGRPAF